MDTEVWTFPLFSGKVLKLDTLGPDLGLCKVALIVERGFFPECGIREFRVQSFSV
jgi:hypothetical protein